MHSIGLIADTHGWLAPFVCPAFASAKVEHILHAGDVGPGDKSVERSRPDGRSLLAALSVVAPVDAVRGNTTDDLGHDLPATLVHCAGEVRFVVHHGDKIPHKDQEAVLAALQPEGGWRSAGDIVVYGHSHVPRFERHASGVSFLNPGTAGGPSEYIRFGKRFPQQVAIVRCSGTAFDVSAIDLQTGQEHAWAQGELSAATATSTASRKPWRKRAVQPATSGHSQRATRRLRRR
jgi:putative phosphoesterase